ncbi:MAG: dihydrodipicolinate reductase [Acidobacteria bacterium]|nr:dihydrodipicolinate reductase [Acidobacteriota bacterium]
MNLALIGYGKMGRMVEALALARGHRILFKIDIEGNEQGQALTAANFKGVEVAVDFSIPDAVLRNVERITALGVSMVVGTTGWWSQIERVRQLVGENGVGFVYGSNFSIGVNVFFQLMEAAATLFQLYPQYDPWIYEIHHCHKLDAPSGTALKLKQILEKAFGERPISIASNRAGTVPGEHIVGFDSESDTLTFTHTARSRLGFAAGALHAAEWIRSRRGFYEFSDTLAR